MKTGMDYLQKDKNKRTSPPIEFFASVLNPYNEHLRKTQERSEPHRKGLVLSDIVLGYRGVQPLRSGYQEIEEIFGVSPEDSIIQNYIVQPIKLEEVREQLIKALKPLEVILREQDKQLERAEQEIVKLTNRIQSVENQKRMDISYALASEDAKRILNLLVNKVTINIDEVTADMTESDILNVVCDLCKARLANLKGKKLIVTSLGLKVAKKLQGLND